MTKTTSKILSFLSAIVIATSCVIIPTTYANTTSAASYTMWCNTTEESFTDNELACIDALVEGYKNLDTRIDISSYKITEDRNQIIWRYIIENYPEIFWIHTGGNNRYNTKTVKTSSGSTKEIIDYTKPDYWFTKSERDAAQAKIDTAVNELLANIDDDWSDVEKAMYVHNYIAALCYYEEENDEHTNNIDNIYSVFVLHKANCRGYSTAYQYVMKKLGFDCVNAGNATHQWNMLKIDGNWYHIDVCQDDYPNGSDAYLVNTICYDRFMLSDTAAKKIYGSELDKAYSATDTSYDNAFWNTATTMFVYYEPTETWYGCTDTGIVSYNFETNKLKRIYSFKDEWDADGTWFEDLNLSRVVLIDDTLYFNTTNSVLSYNIPTKTLRTVKTSSICKSSDKQIYYLYASNNMLKYAVSDDVKGDFTIYKAKDLA